MYAYVCVYIHMYVCVCVCVYSNDDILQKVRSSPSGIRKILLHYCIKYRRVNVLDRLVPFLAGCTD